MNYTEGGFEIPSDHSAWWRRRDALGSFFTEAEISHLIWAREQVSAELATVVYAVYENPFAKGGGIFAVADLYTQALQQSGRNVVALSPLHARFLPENVDAAAPVIAEFEVPFGHHRLHARLREHIRHNVRWLLIEASDFFTGGEGGTDLYTHSERNKLLIDSLFFSAAVPYALAAIGLRHNVLAHLQDWQTAAAALTVKQGILEGVLETAAVVQTLHNAYDQPILAHELRMVTARPARTPAGTVLHYMLPLSDSPITTVSRTFAQELLSDPLQKEHFAPHLQGVLHRHGLVGVDNGQFAQSTPPYSENAVTAARGGDPEKILEEKAARRQKMLEVLGGYHPEGAYGWLNGGDDQPLESLPEEVPVLMMFGRLDPGQKGFDVLARAIAALPRGIARFVLTPVVSGAPASFRNDLQQLAERFPGEVVVYPFRMQQGYLETMAGASFAVMPSLYEPFGGATEPYLQGTPVVARNTGGLRQQVNCLNAEATTATGILYRENPPEWAQRGSMWQRMLSLGSPDERTHVPLYGALVASLTAALMQAIDLYRWQPAMYGRLLANVFEKSQQFSWDRAQQEYMAVYRLAVQPQP